LAVVSGIFPNLTTDRFGVANAAYHFSNGGNISVPYRADLNPQAMTLSLWIRQDTAGRTDHPDDCYIISLGRWNRWKFQPQPTRPFLTLSTDSAIYDRDGGTELTLGTTIGAGPWTHLAASYDGIGTEKFYINGGLIKTWTNLAGKIKLINPTCNLSIGSDLPVYDESDITDPNYFAKSGYWTGDLDDIMIYNFALTNDQVTQLHSQQVTR
jgi:hypothetical protein